MAQRLGWERLRALLGGYYATRPLRWDRKSTYEGDEGDKGDGGDGGDEGEVLIVVHLEAAHAVGDRVRIVHRDHRL